MTNLFSFYLKLFTSFHFIIYLNLIQINFTSSSLSSSSSSSRTPTIVNLYKNETIHSKRKQTQLNENLNKYKLNKLLKVFGLEKHGSRKKRHFQPPQYMLDLYNSIADIKDGITRTPNPYHADIIRSFINQEASHSLRFYFNISGRMDENEKILEAEFHLFKLKPKFNKKDSKNIHLNDPRSHLLDVRVYQLLTNNYANESEKRLLDVRRMSLHSTGWEVFYIKQAVLDWFHNSSSNFGLLITVRSMLNEKVDENIFRYSKRHNKHSNYYRNERNNENHHQNNKNHYQHTYTNKQPVLVIFTNDGREKVKISDFDSPKLNIHDYGYRELSFTETVKKIEKQTHLTNETLERQRRSISKSSLHKGYKNRNRVYDNHSSYSASKQHLPISAPSSTFTSSSSSSSSAAAAAATVTNSASCSLNELYVDFETIGWSAWIISPRGYKANYCKGDCNFPLGQNLWPTNHATVQSIIHELNLNSGVVKPCCVPNKLSSITLLYFDDQDNVILKHYDEMVAVSCGCH